MPAGWSGSAAPRSARVKPAVRQAGLPQDLRFHDLRHTCVALLIDLGLQQYDVMRHLGHSSIKTTLDLYGHKFPNRDGELRQGLNEIYRRSLTGRMRDAQDPVEIKDWPAV